VKTIVLGGQTVTGGKARSAFALRSSNFTVSYANGPFTFSVLGYGHGVGMSQTGAETMARQGSGYKQILAWYYPSSTLTSL
jgi:stage II sporulation protein D